MSVHLLRRLGRPALAGVLGALAFPLVAPGCNTGPILDGGPREIAILGAAALLFHIARDGRPLRARMAEAFLAGVIHFALLLYWLDIAMVRFGGMPQWQAVLAILLLVGYCALYWAALPALVDLAATSRLRFPAPFAFAFAVVALEWLRGALLTGFPWGLWGYSQARNLGLVQIAALAGVYGVSWVVALVGGLLSEALQAPRRTQAWVRLVLVVVVAHAVGWVVLATRRADRDFGLRVGVVQGNINQSIKNESAAHRSLILGEYLALTRRAVDQGADIVVWPEAAWPGQVHAEAHRLPGFAPGRPTLVGATTHRVVAGANRGLNSVFWVAGDGRVGGRYDKRHLVPFGEYVPLRSVLPVEKVTPGLLDYSPGHSAAPIGEPPWGILICYDGIFPHLARENVKAGAAVLANLTNDAWYGVSSAPYQHRDFYILRAVETDRWVVRAANTGVSFFAGPDGRIHGATELNTADVALLQVWPRDSTTIYMRTGDWLPATSIGGILGLVLGAVWDRLHRRRHHDAG